MNGFRQLPVGGRHHPHIHLNVANAAQPPEGLLFQNAQQLGLHRERHLANLIQENGSPGSDLQNSRLGRARIREGAFLIAQ